MERIIRKKQLKKSMRKRKKEITLHPKDKIKALSSYV
jgi:hypothetical protein